MITIVAKNFIGGIWHEGPLDLSTLNPAKLSEVAGQAHSASAEDVAYGVQVARKALDKTRSIGPAKRADLVDALVQPMRRYATEIAKYLTHECGFTLKESQEEVLEAICYCQLVAGQGACLASRQVSWHPAHRDNQFVRRPIGVVTCFPSWREPFAGTLKLILPAVMAGNAVIIKAPEHAIAISQWLARLILESGLGEGLVSVVHGTDESIGCLLASDTGVDALIGDFGEERAARYRQAIAGRLNARLEMEPVGLNGVAVFDDAPIEKAASIALEGAFLKSGQLRSSTKIAWVAEPLFDAFVQKATDMIKLVRVGDGLQESTTMGPLANVEAFESYLNGVGQVRGDTVIDGHPVNQGERLDLFVSPHVAKDSGNASPYFGDGPSLLIRPLNSLDQILGPMNSLSIVTRSASTIRQVRENCRCNRLLVNVATTGRTAPDWEKDLDTITRTLTIGAEA